MKIIVIASLVAVLVSPVPSFAQDPTIQSMQSAIQALQARQVTTDERLSLLELVVPALESRTTAVEARTTTIEAKVVTLQNAPGMWMSILAPIGNFFSNPVVISAIATIATCHFAGKC